jgi:nucleoside-diphosphate-sugar epimerase/choline dehydrogenase-like flavoprotein
VKLFDIRHLGEISSFDCDVCIVGSGPAGWALSEALRDTSLRVTMLESGSILEDAGAGELNSIEDVGVPTFNGRGRCLGGTSALWWGRCIALDPIDFERRSWVESSGWPIDSETLEPYMRQAADLLGARPWADGSFGPVRGWPGAALELRASQLVDCWWEDTAPLDTGRALLGDAPRNLQVLTNATVTHINVDPDSGAVRSVEVGATGCSPRRLSARTVVLCAGGIENARILLYSNRQRSAGLGNETGCVGRYFMDHPRDLGLAVRFAVRDAARVRQSFGVHRLDNGRGVVHAFSRGVGLSPEKQRAEGLLNCAAIPFEEASSDGPEHAAIRLIMGERSAVRRDLRAIIERPGRALAGLASFLADSRFESEPSVIGFVVISEQAPDRESRVSLGSGRDRLGLPVARVDWHIGEQEVRSQIALAKSIREEFAQLGLPPVQLADWVLDGGEGAELRDGCHPMGTTRMSVSPRSGVVDANCQVHGVRGLYVAGSSLFPTGGHANPTLTIVALSLRLGEHLRMAVSDGDAPSAQGDAAFTGSEAPAAPEPHGVPAEPLPTLPAGTVAAVTGATGFIGGRLAEVLTAQGIRTVALTRNAGGRNPLPHGVERRVVDLADAAATREALRDVDALFHCAYDWGDESWNLRAIRSIADVCARNRCRLVHVGSFVTYEGARTGEITEHDPPTSAGAGYAWVKRQLDEVLLNAAREQDLQVSIVQPTIVYGPGCKPWTIDPADRLRFGTVVLPDDRRAICNAVYVDDVIQAMLLAATRPEAVGERFLVSGPPVSWADFHEGIAAAIGAEGPRYWSAGEIAAAMSPVGRIRRLLSDPTYLLRALWFHPVARRLLERGLTLLPTGTQRAFRRVVQRPETQLRGLLHLPDPALAESTAVVSIDHARAELGFDPKFDFAAGMLPTGIYLQAYCKLTTSRHNPAT